MPSKRLERLVQFASRFASAGDFEAAIRPGHGLKRANHVFGVMDRNTRGRLPAEAKSVLERASKWWVLTPVPVRLLKQTHVDSMRPDYSKVDLTKPLVLGKRLEILDGRHRHAKARAGGIDTLMAWVPAREFFRLVC